MKTIQHAAFVLLLTCVACGPSIEDSIAKLGGGPDEREAAKQELLLAKDRSVGPLLAALDDPQHAAAHCDLIDVLTSLMMRVDDARIQAALRQFLLGDAPAPVRSRVAERLGLIKHAALGAALLQATRDQDGEVRFQALQGLADMEAKLSAAQVDSLDETARRLLADPHPARAWKR